MHNQAFNKEIDIYFSLLTPGQKESVISLIKSFLKTDKRISSKQYNKEISEAEKRVSKGKFITQEALEKKSQKWCFLNV